MIGIYPKKKKRHLYLHLNFSTYFFNLSILIYLFISTAWPKLYRLNKERVIYIKKKKTKGKIDLNFMYHPQTVATVLEEAFKVNSTITNVNLNAHLITMKLELQEQLHWQKRLK